LRQRDGILNIKAAYNLVALRIDPVRIHVAPYCINTCFMPLFEEHSTPHSSFWVSKKER